MSQIEKSLIYTSPDTFGRRLIYNKRVKLNGVKLYQVRLWDKTKDNQRVNLHEVEILLLMNWRLGEYTNLKRKLKITKNTLELCLLGDLSQGWYLHSRIELLPDEIQFVKTSSQSLFENVAK